MSTLTVAALRQRVSTAISTGMSASGWRESPTAYDQFPGSDGDNRGHKGYAVGVLRTAVVGQEQRQRLAEGVLVETDVAVRWAYSISALDQVVAYDAALEAEAQIVAAIMAESRSEGLNLVLRDATRTVDDQGTMFGTIGVRALHRWALA